jgi:hypothetical protein
MISGTTPAALKVVESVTTSKGGTFVRLTRARKPEYGRAARWSEGG